LELLQIVAAVDDASVEQGRRFRHRVRVHRSGTDDYNMMGAGVEVAGVGHGEGFAGKGVLRLRRQGRLRSG
jgi:hypothetical protein